MGIATLVSYGAIGSAGIVLTNNAEWKLAQAAEFAYQRRVLIAAIINGQPIVGAVLVARSNRPYRAGHHILTSATRATLFQFTICHSQPFTAHSNTRAFEHSAQNYALIHQTVRFQTAR